MLLFIKCKNLFVKEKKNNMGNSLVTAVLNCLDTQVRVVDENNEVLYTNVAELSQEQKQETKDIIETKKINVIERKEIELDGKKVFIEKLQVIGE